MKAVQINFITWALSVATCLYNFGFIFTFVSTMAVGLELRIVRQLARAVAQWLEHLPRKQETGV